LAPPSRIIDLITEQRALNVIDLKVFALDEADKMLSVGFQSQNKILFSFPPDMS